MTHSTNYSGDSTGGKLFPEIFGMIYAGVTEVCSDGFANSLKTAISRVARNEPSDFEDV
jgi:hypothetical protein